MTTRFLVGTALLGLAVALAGLGDAGRADDEVSAAIEERIADLFVQAREAAAAGREDEARELAGQIANLRRELAVGDDRESRGDEVERKLAAARERVQALREAGQIDKANEFAEAIERFARGERERAEGERREGAARREGEGAEGRPREGGDRGRDRAPDRAAMREHLLQAAEHLDAAGLRDQAEMLRRHARALEGDRGPGPLGLPGPPAFGGPRQGDVELREQVRQLSARIDRIERWLQPLIQARVSRDAPRERDGARDGDAPRERDGARDGDAPRERDGARDGDRERDPAVAPERDRG